MTRRFSSTRHECAPLRNYEKANGIDYHRLAILADATAGVTFETLCERAENGAVTDAELLPALVPVTKDWILIHDVIFILGISLATWNSIIGKHPTELYFGIGAKTRSIKVKLGRGGKGARGCGVLFYRRDIQRLATIKRGARLSLHSALRVFCAMKQGKI